MTGVQTCALPILSKIATKKTAGILGDDLAVNAEKASGFENSREIPVLWAIAKGSLLNKIIILPIAFLLSAFLPKAILFILVLGGIYLAYEGVEKIYNYIFEKKKVVSDAAEANADSNEKNKIKSAIVTDFILSVEIVIIALGTVLKQSLTMQIAVVSIVALVATVGVYGLVGALVRMDDLGLKIVANSKKNSALHTFGNLLIQALPLIVRGLAFVGTVALLLVAGGIFSHNIPFFHDFLHVLPEFLKDLLLGISVGLIALIVIKLASFLYKQIKH